MFEKDIFSAVIVDRGFWDAIDTMEGLGLNVALPPFLNGRQQFTTSEAWQILYKTLQYRILNNIFRSHPQ